MKQLKTMTIAAFHSTISANVSLYESVNPMKSILGGSDIRLNDYDFIWTHKHKIFKLIPFYYKLNNV